MEGNPSGTSSKAKVAEFGNPIAWNTLKEIEMMTDFS
ncbi:hypothetical protein GGQ57_003084 [Parabacteroides faecis]|uniref:Uncharacterized protein n=1 Tax=Parabacteroides faecis TaxID=1217282 RepID=A0ABR6KQL8_9BACT|nr:hypothetical protein [Parabacteroides faecis]